VTGSGLPYEWSGTATGDFDTVRAATFQGKYILIGVTYANAQGQAEGSVSMHGVIASATRDGIKVALKGTREGESWTMPPNLDAISEAPPGRYKLQETGEEIENPDLIAIWTVATPKVD
jgi:hypothetical protein